MADTTAMFVVGLYHYFQWTGDQATLDRLWPAAKRAMAWVMVDSTKGAIFSILLIQLTDTSVYNNIKSTQKFALFKGIDKCKLTAVQGF